MTSVLFVCTRDAARSVMAGAALSERRSDLHVETARTLSVEGMPISWRTRAARDAVASRRSTGKVLIRGLPAS